MNPTPLGHGNRLGTALDIHRNFNDSTVSTGFRRVLAGKDVKIEPARAPRISTGARLLASVNLLEARARLWLATGTTRTDPQKRAALRVASAEVADIIASHASGADSKEKIAQLTKTVSVITSDAATANAVIAGRARSHLQHLPQAQLESLIESLAQADSGPLNLIRTAATSELMKRELVGPGTALPSQASVQTWVEKRFNSAALAARGQTIEGTHVDASFAAKDIHRNADSRRTHGRDGTTALPQATPAELDAHFRQTLNLTPEATNTASFFLGQTGANILRELTSGDTSILRFKGEIVTLQAQRTGMNDTGSLPPRMTICSDDAGGAILRFEIRQKASTLMGPAAETRCTFDAGSTLGVSGEIRINAQGQVAVGADLQLCTDLKSGGATVALTTARPVPTYDKAAVQLLLDALANPAPDALKAGVAAFAPASLESLAMHQHNLPSQLHERDADSLGRIHAALGKKYVGAAAKSGGLSQPMITALQETTRAALIDKVAVEASARLARDFKACVDLAGQADSASADLSASFEAACLPMVRSLELRSASELALPTFQRALQKLIDQKQVTVAEVKDVFGKLPAETLMAHLQSAAPASSLEKALKEVFEERTVLTRSAFAMLLGKLEATDLDIHTITRTLGEVPALQREYRALGGTESALQKTSLDHACGKAIEVLKSGLASCNDSAVVSLRRALTSCGLQNDSVSAECAARAGKIHSDRGGPLSAAVRTLCDPACLADPTALLGQLETVGAAARSYRDALNVLGNDASSASLLRLASQALTAAEHKAVADVLQTRLEPLVSEMSALRAGLHAAETKPFTATQGSLYARLSAGIAHLEDCLGALATRSGQEIGETSRTPARLSPADQQAVADFFGVAGAQTAHPLTSLRLPAANVQALQADIDSIATSDKDEFQEKLINGAPTGLTNSFMKDASRVWRVLAPDDTGTLREVPAPVTPTATVACTEGFQKLAPTTPNLSAFATRFINQDGFAAFTTALIAAMRDKGIDLTVASQQVRLASDGAGGLTLRFHITAVDAGTDKSQAGRMAVMTYELHVSADQRVMLVDAPRIEDNFAA